MTFSKMLFLQPACALRKIHAVLYYTNRKIFPNIFHKQNFRFVASLSLFPSSINNKKKKTFLFHRPCVTFYTTLQSYISVECLFCFIYGFIIPFNVWNLRTVCVQRLLYCIVGSLLLLNGKGISLIRKAVVGLRKLIRSITQ